MARLHQEDVRERTLRPARLESRAQGAPKNAEKPQRRLSLPDTTKSEVFPSGWQPTCTRKKPGWLGLVKDWSTSATLPGKAREMSATEPQWRRSPCASGSSSKPSPMPIHMADMGTDNMSRNSTRAWSKRCKYAPRVKQPWRKSRTATTRAARAPEKPSGRPRLEASPGAVQHREYARKLNRGGWASEELWKPE